MKYLNKLFKGFGNILTYTLHNQMGLQSNIFWIIALFKLKTPDFWNFAIPAILFRGIQLIIDELKNKK